MTRKTKYIFTTMEVGDKAHIPTKKADKDKALYNLRTAASIAKKGTLKVFSCYTDETGVGYLRLKDKEVKDENG